jgi:hypothetical protein
MVPAGQLHAMLEASTHCPLAVQLGSLLPVLPFSLLVRECARGRAPSPLGMPPVLHGRVKLHVQIRSLPEPRPQVRYLTMKKGKILPPLGLSPRVGLRLLSGCLSSCLRLRLRRRG